MKLYNKIYLLFVTLLFTSIFSSLSYAQITSTTNTKHKKHTDTHQHHTMHHKKVNHASAASVKHHAHVKHAHMSVAYHPQAQDSSDSPVLQRENEDESIPRNDYFAISLYKPTYILPYYYTGSPYNQVYTGNTPNDEQLKHPEVKYQFSFKVPVWQNILHSHSSLFLAYTQLSYWQLYDNRAFFRESDYEPEIFLENEVNWSAIEALKLNFINVGATHQSNGFGNSLERSWNRLYVDFVFSTDHWMVGVKPWYVLSTNGHNDNIANYLGHGEIRAAYKIKQQVFSIQAHNLIEQGARRATATIAWSFPITPYIKGYVQVFSGYGQSLIEYDHRTNSAGVGIALNDWI